MIDLDLAQFVDTFFEEAVEHASALESALVGLDTTPEDTELIGAAFRAAHSLKGSSAIFSLTNITRFTHTLEALLDDVRKGVLGWSAPLAGLLFRSVDIIRELIATRGADLSPEGETLLAELGAFGKARPPSIAIFRPETSAPAASDTFIVRFKPEPQIFERGTDVLLVLRELDEVAEVLSTEVDTSALPHLDEIEPTVSYLAWTFVVRSPGGPGALKEVFEFVDDVAEVEIERGGHEPEPAPEPEPIAASPVVHVAAAPPPAQAKANPPAAAGAAGEGSTVRIATKKLDRILDILGEVVIAKSMIAQGVMQTDASAELREALVTLERQTRELQESVMSVRMVPISTVFSRFHRVVRELGTKLGKSVDFVLEGMETEIDRAMVEQLADPLMHLVRNAIDHGIERTEDRRAAGKPEAGTLRLAASHRGGNVVIEILDDGKGLDVARVKAKAIANGLLAPDAEPTMEELHMLVFAPGFSTAAAVTEVSGRGVGMDVVMRNVQALGGSIRFTSEPGRGSSIVLQLPLTMAIIDGLLLRVGTGTFVVPLRSVVESLRPTRAQVGSIFGQTPVLHFRERTIPLIPVARHLDQPEPDDPTKGIVVVVESGDVTLGLVVDELIADTQVVVKSLEANYRNLEGIAGATVLGDGTIALILDIGSFARRASPTAPDIGAFPLPERSALTNES